MSDHALLSPSAAHRWLNCTPAPRLEATLPDNTSEYAEEGTLAHCVCEATAKKKFKKIKAAECTKTIKRLKKKLMGEIVSLVDEAEQEGKEDAPQKIEQNKKLVEDCNQRLEGYQDELLELPREIEQANFKLMLATMDYCYDTMQENGADIQEIAQWVTEVRIELKKRLIRKQEMEQRNNAIYSYMHDVFGAEVIEIFDMKYNPDQRESGAGEE